MKSILLLLTVCFLASAAFAVVDPDPDIMGIYFDTNADEICLTMGPNIPFDFYLIVTNSSYAGISAYECTMELDVPVGLEGMVFRFASMPVTNPIYYFDENGPLGGDYIVGLGIPVPTGPATVLHHWQYMLLTDMPVEIFLGACSVPSIPGDLPVIQVDNIELIQVGLSTGGPDIPVATINTGCPLGTEERTFGGVKALFR